MELVLKTSDVARHRGFESLSLRQIKRKLRLGFERKRPPSAVKGAGGTL